MSVPPSPNPSSNDAPAAGGRKFGATPIGAFVTMVIIVVGGAALYVFSANRIVRATCGGDRMRPGDTCTTTRRGVPTGTQNYTEVLAQAQRMNDVFQYVGIGLVVIGVLFAVLTFVRWRQDVATRASLTNEHGAPISSHARTASSSFLLLAFGAAFIGGAIYCLLAGMARDQPGYYAGTAICGLIGLAMLWGAIPSNGQLVQVYAEGVRVVAKGKVVDLPWREVGYQIVPQKNAANHNLTGPGLDSAITMGALSDAKTLEASVQQHSVQAKYQPTLEAINRGETVAFGQLSISSAGLTYGNKSLSWQEYAGITLHQGQVTIAKLPKGRFATIGLGLVHNYALLVHVIEAIVKQQPRTTAGM